jgi:hypothetical protein
MVIMSVNSILQLFASGIEKKWNSEMCQMI